MSLGELSRLLFFKTLVFELCPMTGTSNTYPLLVCRGEALFADLGHFSRPAIQLATFGLVVSANSEPHALLRSTGA